MIEKIWRNLLTEDELGNTIVAPCDVDDLVCLLVECKINPQKFIGNLLALTSQGMPDLFDLDKPSLPKTPSVDQYISLVNRPPGSPLWLLAGFPDINAWIEETSTSELFDFDDDKLQDLSESDVKNVDGSLRVFLYRKIILNYIAKTGKKLEVAFEEGEDVHKSTLLNKLKNMIFGEKAGDNPTPHKTKNLQEYTKEILCHIDKIHEEAENADGEFLFLMLNEVCSEAKRIASENKEATEASMKEMAPPEKIALILISNVAADKLEFGNFYIYRGVLNMQGHSLREIYRFSCSMMLKKGYSTPDEAKEDGEWLDEVIKSSG